MNPTGKKMKRELLGKVSYKNGYGFAVYTDEAPKEARTKADTICLCTKKDKSFKQYYTPDEAMSVAFLLLKAVDTEMNPFFNIYREEKDAL